MREENNLVIASVYDNQVRIRAAETTALVEEARKAHDCWPTACAALGRTLTATGILASDLKDPEARVVSTINGHGPLGTIVAQSDGAGNVRGFVGNPEVYLFNEKTGKLDVGRAVGTDGTLTVSKDLGLKEPFTGMVPLVSGEIAEDFCYYLAVSEQVRSAVALGVLVSPDSSVRAAGGMIMQLMPDAGEDAVARLEAVTREMQPISSFFERGLSAQETIRELFPEAKILEQRSLRWHCGCSKEHFADALALIKTEELDAMIAEDHGAEVRCQYCGKTYTFSEDELKAIREKHIHAADRQSVSAE